MDATACATVAATVVVFTQFAKWSGVPDSKGPLAVLVLSALGVLIWGWSTGGIHRADAFNYLAGYGTIVTSAAGIFGFTRASSEGIAKMTSPPAGGAGSSTTIKDK